MSAIASLRKQAIVIVVFLVLGPGSGCKREAEVRPIQVVSWGGEFQKDLIDNWVLPSANACGISIETAPWNGDYAALTARITKGINTWDLVHVEAHYVKIPDSKNIFESFPARRITDELTGELADDTSVPVLEYGYVLAYRTESIRTNRKLDWKDFWDTRSYPGRRGLRDFPIGNIEIALLALGRDVNKELYDPKLTRDQVEQQVRDALNHLSRIKREIVWWKTGDQLQRDIEHGDTPLSAAWSGRIWSAYKTLCSGQKPEDCVLQASPNTAMVSTDWWIIPKGARGRAQANRLLECMFRRDSLKGAVAFSVKQGYLVPASGVREGIGDDVAKYYLGLGSSSDRPGNRIQEEFWGRHFEWISSRWNAWREE